MFELPTKVRFSSDIPVKCKKKRVEGIKSRKFIKTSLTHPFFVWNQSEGFGKHLHVNTGQKFPKTPASWITRGNHKNAELFEAQKQLRRWTSQMGKIWGTWLGSYQSDILYTYISIYRWYILVYHSGILPMISRFSFWQIYVDECGMWHILNNNINV